MFFAGPSKRGWGRLFIPFTTENFRYEHLPIEPVTVRLIRIDSPPDEDGVIHCSLKDFALDGTQDCERIATDEQRLEYTTVSYTWEPKYPFGVISLNNKRKYIGRNLWDLLHQLSIRTDKLRYPWLWIDAICINQLNSDEKQHQVASMGRIYRAAASLLVWLGNGDADTDFALDVIARLHNTNGLSPYHSTTSGCLEDVLGRFQQGLAMSFCLAAKAFLAVSRRHYWERRWVVQEMASRQQDPKAHLVLCGSKEVSLVQLDHYCSEAFRLYYGHDEQASLATSILEMCRDPQFDLTSEILSESVFGLMLRIPECDPQAETANTSLSQLLNKHSRLKCQSAWDKVYAFLPMCLEGSFILPDYKLDLCSVFWKLAGFATLPNGGDKSTGWGVLTYHVTLATDLLLAWEHETDFLRRLVHEATNDQTDVCFKLNINYRHVSKITSVASRLEDLKGHPSGEAPIEIIRGYKKANHIDMFLSVEPSYIPKHSKWRDDVYEIYNPPSLRQCTPKTNDIILDGFRNQGDGMLVVLRKANSGLHKYQIVYTLIKASIFSHPHSSTSLIDEQTCDNIVELEARDSPCESCQSPSPAEDRSRPRTCYSHIIIKKATFLAFLAICRLDKQTPGLNEVRYAEKILVMDS